MNRSVTLVQARHPMQPTLQTARTCLPKSWLEQVTTTMRSTLKGTMVMMRRGHARAQAPQPVHFP